MSLFPPGATLDDKIQIVLIFMIRVSAFVALGMAIYLNDIERIFDGISGIVLLFLPNLIERVYKVKLPIEYSFLVVLFMYCSIVLGAMASFYSMFEWWDTALHVMFGLLLGFGSFIFLHSLSLQQKLITSNVLLNIIAFSIATTVGVFWEFFEFALDQMFTLSEPMQTNLWDTNIDLIANSIGALLSSILGYMYLAHPNGNGILVHFVGKFIRANPHLRRGKNG